MCKFFPKFILSIILCSSVFFSSTKLIAQSSQAVCNTYTPLTNSLFTNLTVTSSQFLGSDHFAQKNNIKDADLTNSSTWNALIGGSAFLEIKDNNAVVSQVYTGGSYAGFVVDNNTLLLLGSSVSIKTYLGTTEQENVSSASLIKSNILGGNARIGFITTQNFDRIRISFSGLSVAGSVTVLYAEIKKFCAGVIPDCNNITALNNPVYPSQINAANTGFTGVALGNFLNEENIVSADKNDFAVMNLPVGILATGNIAVKDPISNYPSGYFAGFDIANVNLNLTDLLNVVTISTYLNGVLQENKTNANLILGTSVLSAANRSTIGFITTVPFNEIKLTISQVATLNVGPTNIYNAVVQRFCAGPALACNVITPLLAPTFPLIIASENTGLEGAACTNCLVQNTPNIIDSITTNFAVVNIVAGALSAGKISIKNPITVYAAGTYAAFEIENANLLTAELLNNLQINFYNNGTLVQSATGPSQIIAANTFLFNGNNRFQIGIAGNFGFNEVQLKIFNTTNIAIGEVKIYNILLQKSCLGILDCNSAQLLNSPNFPVVIESTRTGISGLACIGCSITGVNNVISSSTTDFASINLNGGAIETGAISVRDQAMVYPKGIEAGFIVRDPNNFLQLNLANALTISTYLNGTLQETKTGIDLLIVDAVLINIGGANSLQNVGFVTTKIFNEIRIGYSNILGGFTYLDVFGAYINTSSIPFGTVGFDCNQSYPDFNVSFRNIVVNGNVNTNDKVSLSSIYGSAIPAGQSINPSIALPIINTDGTYSFVANTAGVYRFYVPVCEDTICKNELLQISILEPSIGFQNFPTSNTDIALTLENTNVIIKSLLNDQSGISGFALMPNSVTITDINGSSAGNTKNGGTAVVNLLNGDITYSPPLNYVGADTIFYGVCDNQNPQKCSNAFQILHVLPAVSKNTIVALDDYFVTSFASNAVGNLKLNDSDPEGNNIAVAPQTTTVAGKGTLVLNADGSFVFTPVNGYVGPIDFVYNICDDASTSACANATLHMLVKLASPDLTPSTRISNATFIGSNNTVRDFVIEVSELLNVVTNSSINPIQIRLVKSDNFSYTFNPTAVSATIPAITPVQNNDWDLITNTSSVMIFQMKPGQNISSLSNSKFVIKLQVLAGAATGVENQTIGIINGSGAEINFNNNAVVRILNIEN